MQKNHQNRPLDEAQKALIAQLKNITTSDYRRLRSRIHGLSNVKKSDNKQKLSKLSYLRKLILLLVKLSLKT